ncbi:class I SAM-dependent methyltransferase [Rhodopila sp.]|uniref:class I SAM-dependent methyltransferase n=1 Tax=Rhodopila sp. TaxID=2480087 RepID=UPI003D0EE2E1
MPDSDTAIPSLRGARPKAALAAIIRALPTPSRSAVRAAIQALTGDRPSSDHDQDGPAPQGLIMGDIDLYWENSFPLIEGWVNDRWREHLKLLNDTQNRLGITGHIGEIGVFHGKLLIALAHLAQPGTKVTAIDVFDDQSKNIDGAGVGSLDQLTSNIDAHGPRSGLDYAFVKADSAALNAADILKLGQDRGPFRLFSVDGCHTAEHTLNDLLTAQDCLAPGGVIMLDDMFQAHWPGVTEAVGLFYSRYVPRVKPFLYCAHKMFFIGHGWHADFLRLWSEQFGQRPDAKLTQMYGNTFLSLFP